MGSFGGIIQVCVCVITTAPVDPRSLPQNIANQLPAADVPMVIDRMQQCAVAMRDAENGARDKELARRVAEDARERAAHAEEQMFGARERAAAAEKNVFEARERAVAAERNAFDARGRVEQAERDKFLARERAEQAEREKLRASLELVQAQQQPQQVPAPAPPPAAAEEASASPTAPVRRRRRAAPAAEADDAPVPDLPDTTWAGKRPLACLVWERVTNKGPDVTRWEINRRLALALEPDHRAHMDVVLRKQAGGAEEVLYVPFSAAALQRGRTAVTLPVLEHLARHMDAWPARIMWDGDDLLTPPSAAAAPAPPPPAKRRRPTDDDGGLIALLRNARPLDGRICLSGVVVAQAVPSFGPVETVRRVVDALAGPFLRLGMSGPQAHRFTTRRCGTANVVYAQMAAPDDALIAQLVDWVARGMGDDDVPPVH